MRFVLVLLLLLSGVQPAVAQLISGQAAQQPVAASAAAPATPVRQMLARDIAVLQVLDKVSARTTRLRVPVGSSAAFGLIFITVRSCQVSPPSEPPESAAFLEISEVDVNSLPRRDNHVAAGAVPAARLLFSGWMFASSPALSALEHPTYDVSVTGCEVRTVTAAERAATGEEGPAVGSAASGAAADEGAATPPEPAPID